MQLKNAMCIEDLRRMAHRNVPGVFIDYMEAGSYSEHTRDANVDDMKAIRLRQRVLVDVSQRNLKTTVLGEELAMPLALAPTGLAGMQYADGEIWPAAPRTRPASSSASPRCRSARSRTSPRR
jgi:L-lactate dehydrogenase (cytochrome)